MDDARSTAGLTRKPALAIACGALGAFDPSRVSAIAEALPTPTRVEHEDRHSILMLDREPLRWESQPDSGLVWSEHPGAETAKDVGRWEDAATDLLASGLAIQGESRLLHASVSGVQPLYFQAERDAVYFATRVDALARTAPTLLSIDWDAWAAILTLRHPLGDRTPFAEIRRLGPFERLCWEHGSVKRSTGRWPWAEVEPRLSLDEGAGAVVETMREALALPAGPVTCLLSGGWDSRISAALLAQANRDGVLTLTTQPDTHEDRETAAAAAVAKAFGLQHEVVAGEPERRWDDLTLLAERADFQTPRPPWRMALLPAMRARPAAPTLDSFCLDVWAAAGDRFFGPGASDPSGGLGGVHEVWSELERRASARNPFLKRELTRALQGSARAQFVRDSQRFDGHPLRAVLTFYCTRSVRGIALGPFAVHGAETPMLLPYTNDALVRSMLAIRMSAKENAALYHALFEAIDPRLATLPSTRSLAAQAPEARRHDIPAAASVADSLSVCLRDGPLTPFLRPAALRSLERHRRGRSARVPMREAVRPAFFHLWHRRYRELLREDDPGEALGLRPA